MILLKKRLNLKFRRSPNVAHASVVRRILEDDKDSNDCSLICSGRKFQLFIYYIRRYSDILILFCAYFCDKLCCSVVERSLAIWIYLEEKSQAFSIVVMLINYLNTVK